MFINTKQFSVISFADGNNEAERMRVDLILEESQEFRNGWVRLCYSPTFVCTLYDP